MVSSFGKPAFIRPARAAFAARPWLGAALVVAAGAAATLLGALFFEHVVGLAPCPLCLEQRNPYYVGVPLSLAVAASAALGFPACVTRAGLALLAVIFLWAAGLGVYHAGAEWGFWPGPATCAAPQATATTVTDLLRQLQAGPRVVDCTVVSWRFMGLSLAGWNVAVAACLAAIALAAASRACEPGAGQGSSSVSQ